MYVAKLLGLSDPLLGVIIGWGLATITALVGGVVSALRARRSATAKRKASARLILEELSVAQRSVDGADSTRLLAGILLPTDVWNQRREDLVDTDEWPTVATAFAAVDDLNAARVAQLKWRSESSAAALQQAREDARDSLTAAVEALRRIAE